MSFDPDLVASKNRGFCSVRFLLPIIDPFIPPPSFDPVMGSTIADPIASHFEICYRICSDS